MCSYYVLQECPQSPIQGLKHDWTLIKLEQDHPSLDFLIVARPFSKDSQKLFLIQVSNSRYENRDNDKKFDSIRYKFKKFCNNAITPLDHYSQMFSISKNNCFYVYASPEPSSGLGHTTPYQRIYFATID